MRMREMRMPRFLAWIRAGRRVVALSLVMTVRAVDQGSWVA